MSRALPENVHELRGNAGKRPAKKRPRPVRGIPTAPTWLDAEAKAEWRRITPELHRLGLLTLIDRAVLAMYCDAWSKWVDAAKDLAAVKIVVEDKAHTGIKKHPAWQIYRQAGDIAAARMAKLGLNPADRDRMHAPEPEPNDGPTLD